MASELTGRRKSLIVATTVVCLLCAVAIGWRLRGNDSVAAPTSPPAKNPTVLRLLTAKDLPAHFSKEESHSIQLLGRACASDTILKKYPHTDVLALYSDNNDNSRFVSHVIISSDNAKTMYTELLAQIPAR